MKHYDHNFNELGEVPQQFSELFHQQAQLLYDLTGQKEEIYQIIQNRMANTILITCGVENGSVVRPSMYNGRLSKFRLGNAAASVTLAKQVLKNDGWSFTTGINIRKGAYDPNNPKSYRGSLPHEVFHAMAENVTAVFNDEGVCYAKGGFLVFRFDREDNLVSKLTATALNEGTTEMLANMFNNTMQTHSYTFPTFIARILHCSRHSPSLLEAYLAEDEKVVESFFENFNQNQSAITSNDLINLSTSEMVWLDEPENCLNVINASLQYSISSLQTVEELEDFYKYIEDLTINIANTQNKNIGKDIMNMLTELLNKRKLEIESMTFGQMI